VSTAVEADRALRIAHLPLKVLVENRLRDGALLEVAVRLLAGEPLRCLWIEPPMPPVVEVVHAGGIGDMPRFIEDEANRSKAGDVPLRLVVVADSDRDRAEAPPSVPAQRIEQTAARHGAHTRILTKHESENYIPDFHWRLEKDRDPRNPRWCQDMQDILSMTPNDRDYCDMEKRRCKQVPHVYDKNRPYHLEVLQQQIRTVQDPDTLAAMAAELRARDHTDDLIAILDLIDQKR
jgi:hypothetical protein